MSNDDLRAVVAAAATELERRAADLRRERPRDLSPEDSDARVSRALATLATKLRRALADETPQPRQ